MDETCLGTRMVSWEKGRKKWTKLFDPNYIAGNGRNFWGEGGRERAPDGDDEGAG